MTNLIKNCSRAIKLKASDENIISNNILSEENFRGIDLDDSNSNKFFHNMISDCEQMALWLWNDASDNLFYSNNFVNNILYS